MVYDERQVVVLANVFECNVVVDEPDAIEPSKDEYDILRQGVVDIDDELPARLDVGDDCMQPACSDHDISHPAPNQDADLRLVAGLVNYSVLGHASGEFDDARQTVDRRPVLLPEPGFPARLAIADVHRHSGKPHSFVCECAGFRPDVAPITSDLRFRQAVL